MIINPQAPHMTIHLRVTPADDRPGHQRWAIWCGPNPSMIKVLKATPGAFFDSNSKRWIFLKPEAEYGATLQKLLDFGCRIDLEDPKGKPKRVTVA